MSKSNIYETELLKLVFQNIAMTLVGDAAGLLPSAAAGSLYVSLHVGDPGETDVQTTNESAYTGYARKAVVRSAAGFTVTANSVSPAADLDFPACTAVPGGDATHFGIGTAPNGAGKMLYIGTITPNIVMTVGTIPRLTAATTINED